jgi:hypothetical protein
MVDVHQAMMVQQSYQSQLQQVRSQQDVASPTFGLGNLNINSAQGMLMGDRMPSNEIERLLDDVLLSAGAV